LFDELSFFLLDLVGNKYSVTVSLLLLVQSYVSQYMVLHSVADISQAWPSDRGTQLTDQKSICWASVSYALKQTTVSPFSECHKSTPDGF
jgi:hypothetical protein